MDPVEDMEENETVMEPRRSTRSTRKLSVEAAKKPSPARKTRKKVVMIEVEVSEEENDKESDGEPDKVEDEVATDPAIEATDNAVEASDVKEAISVQYQEAMETDLPESNNIQFEDSNSITNDFNSFKGAESSSDAINNESNSCFDVMQETTENGQNIMEDIQLDEINNGDVKDETIDNAEVSSDKGLMDDDIESDKIAVESDKNEPETDKEITEADDKKMEVESDTVESVETVTKEENKEVESNILAADPDAENISEDEFPTVLAVKVPETEEVSDEELPGPKRAELPADTEVVSEEELETVKKEGNNKRKLAEGDYDPGSPTSEGESAAKKPATENLEEVDDQKDKPKKLPELDKYWKAVNDDPSDFTGWTYLLQYVDQENDMEAAREAYDAFLSHYPYCYGYWRKYADYEKRKGNKKRCEEVFERGLKAIPLSVDLWIHYLTYVRTSKADEEEYIRSQFERSLKACGLEFRSDRLWENYIKWETEAKRMQNATVIYERLLATPTQGYSQHFDNFQEHVLSSPPNKILEVDEFLALRKEVKSLLKQDAAEVANNSEMPPGEEDSEEANLQNSDEETKAIRERIISIRRKIHKNTATAVTARWNFEEGIKRPYFHVKPLERCQLKNWQEYLDYEVSQGDKPRIIVLFERCLIACALYEEFWLRFVHYLQGLGDIEELQAKIKDVYERACTIHHLKKPNVHLQWAMFEESIKNYNKAAEILQNLEKSVPNLLQVSYRRINLERRRGELDKCCSLYEHYITNSKNKQISTNLSIKYARFTMMNMKDVDKALEVLNAAVVKDPNNPRLYLQLIDITLHKEGMQEEEVLKIIDSFLEKDSTDTDQKAVFAQRKLEFMEDFGSDIQSVQKAYEDYQKYMKTSKDVSTKKKESKTSTDVAKKDKSQTSTTSASSSYNNYGNYNNSTAGSYQYGNSQQGAYSQYPQYSQGDQYQYSGWQYQGNYSGYNQWGGYGGGYSY